MARNKDFMTIEDVRDTVAYIQSNKHDNEHAHMDEDELYIAVLEAIAQGSPLAQTLASEALKTREISFNRWYA